MSKKLMRLCSWIVTITLMINILPVNTLATESQSSEEAIPVETMVPIVEETILAEEDTEATEDAEILEEVPEKRTEYTKDFKLSNGLHMAAVYPEPVHFLKDGEWEDIDNTLKLAETRSGNVYTNTAGNWLVSFPQDLTGDKSVTVIDGDYTVSFAMVGQLRNTGHVVMKADAEMSLEGIEPAPEEQETIPVIEETIELVDQVTIPTEVVPSQDAEVADDEIAVEITEAPVVDTIPSAPPEDPISEEPTSVSEPEDLVEEATEVSLETTTPTESSEAPTEVIEETTVPEDTTVPEETIPLVETATPVETTIPEAPEVPIEESTLEIAPESTVKIESVALQKFKAADTIATGTNISVAKKSRANIEKVERKGKLEGKLEQVVPEKLTSRLRYDEVYSNTDVVYDLDGHMVKESIVMAQHEADLRGFSYILEVGTMVVELTEDNVIELYDPTGEELIMVMPAPYLFDSAGEYCYDVAIDLKKVDNYYAMSYILPRAWLADEDRVWPVTLDPALKQIGNDSAAVDYTVAEYVTIPKDQYTSQVNAGYSPSTGEMRTYLQYTQLPMALTSADVIVEADITLMCVGGNASASRIEVREVTSSWTKAGLTWSNQPSRGSLVEDYADVTYSSSSFRSFSWEITDLVRQWYIGVNNGLVFQLSSTDVSTARSAGAMNYKAFYSTEFIYDAGNSVLTITYRNNNGLESYWDYTASSTGRAGTGYVNQYTGNLVWVRNVMGFSGNRMPVDINLIYNANDTASNTYGIGYGWRTNYNQNVSQWSVDSSYYVWQDGDGTKHYFKYDGSKAAYIDEDGLDLKLTTTGSRTTKYCITDKYGNKSYFDTNGRLTKMSDNQKTPSNITITYVNTTSPKISQITDGVGRKYVFGYSGADLIQIVYTSTGSAWVRKATFTYTSSQLTKVTDHDGGYSQYAYGDSHLLTSVTEQDGYKLTYTYNTVLSGTEGAKMPRRVTKITEMDGTASGGVLNFSYAQNQTTITDYSGNTQVIQFNTWGNTISVHDGQGRAQKADYTSNKAEEAGSKRGNQLTAASKMQNTVNNLLSDTSFENSTLWYVTNTTLVSQSISSSQAYHGTKSLQLYRATASDWSGGVYLQPKEVAAGESCTFSAYVKGTAYLELNDGSTTYSGEMPEDPAVWTRLELNYTNTSGSSKQVYLRLMTKKAGTSYMDCVQFEKMPTASRYNLIQNGDFTTTSNWSTSSGRTTSTSIAAPQLDGNVYKLTGNTGATNRITQTVKVSGNKGDSFMLAGWGKADSVPLSTSSREFGIVAVFNNMDGTTTTHAAHFNPYVGSSVWQYTAAMITADKAYSSVTIRLAYDYNANTAYFDGIQFYKEEFGETYKYKTDGDLEVVTDTQGGETKYEYDSNHNVKKITLPSGDSINYVYDSYHNVTKATSAKGVVTSYTYDDYGNLLNTTVGSSITTKNTYTTDCNYLAKTVDASGKTTTYSYDTTYGTLKSVQYPNDSDTTKTNYTYDSLQRLTNVSAQVTPALNATSSTLSAAYGYSGDYLETITTGSTVYDFEYGDFGLRKQVTAGSNVLAKYTYTSRTNYLQTLAYGNGDSVQYTYNQQGDVTKQTYEDGANVTFKYNNSGYLASTVDSASGITTMYYYDLSDRMAKYTEKGTNYTHTARYKYDDNNNLINLYDSVMGTAHTTVYAYDSDNRVSSVTDKVDSSVTVSETYNYNTTYGYLNSKAAKSGSTTILTDTFTYETGTGRVDTLNNKSKGNYNVTHNYDYDANGNIVKDATGNTTTYVYDTANQLIRENNQAANKTTVWTYDDAGNITSRKEYAYTTGTPTGTPTTVSYVYGNSSWGDLLTNYNGQTVTSDTIGNITKVGTSRTYTWKHGRQLASSTYNNATWNYTYNADGMRVKRTSGNKAYTYIYNGDMLRYMEYDSNTTDNKTPAKLYFTFDASGLPITVNYTPEGSTTSYLFYYVHNLQGDVEALVHGETGNVSIWYSYDAWGNTVVSGKMDHPGADTLININPFRYRSYVYDSETGLYYVSSRYYDPEIGRWINADDTAYLGADGTPLSYNLFAYCKNNPVMGYDPSGTFDWGSLAQGGGWLATGIAALVVGVSVLTCGVATPLMVGVALATAGAGALTVANGASEIGEAFTGYNVMRDGVFQGNATAYNAYAYSTAAVAQVGTAICGGWSAKNAPRIEAYNNIQNYKYADSAAKHIGQRSYYDSTLLQKQIIKYGSMTSEGNGVYTFRVAGSSFNVARQLMHQGTWELTTINSMKLIGHFLLDY